MTKAKDIDKKAEVSNVGKGLKLRHFLSPKKGGEKAILHQRKQMNGCKQKRDMVAQSEERMVHTIQVQELLSNGVMWWQQKS
jgi:hypothetical protein